VAVGGVARLFENQVALMLMPVGQPKPENTPKHKPLLKMLIS